MMTGKGSEPVPYCVSVVFYPLFLIKQVYCMWWYIFLQDDDVRCNEIRNYSHCEINGTLFSDVT
jgi:hypothetical protein